MKTSYTDRKKLSVLIAQSFKQQGRATIGFGTRFGQIMARVLERLRQNHNEREQQSSRQFQNQLAHIPVAFIAIDRTGSGRHLKVETFCNHRWRSKRIEC